MNCYPLRLRQHSHGRFRASKDVAADDYTHESRPGWVYLIDGLDPACNSLPAGFSSRNVRSVDQHTILHEASYVYKLSREGQLTLL